MNAITQISPPVVMEIVDEGETQYKANAELFGEIKPWLIERGGSVKKTCTDDAIYYDTKNMKLLREGAEYRVKVKDRPNGTRFRHDMKIPQDVRAREVVPDEHDILRRKEIKFKASDATPRLAMFFGQAILLPIQQRVYRLLDKELEQKFMADFTKDKIDYETPRGRVEYSFQTGVMKTMDGKRQTPLLHILELELREGDEALLIEELALLHEKFQGGGLTILPDRKVMMGFELLVPDMSIRQRHAFEDARLRNRRPEIIDLTGQKLELAA